MVDTGRKQHLPDVPIVSVIGKLITITCCNLFVGLQQSAVTDLCLP